jgi:hypothetical protein
VSVQATSFGPTYDSEGRADHTNMTERTWDCDWSKAQDVSLLEKRGWSVLAYTCPPLGFDQTDGSLPNFLSFIPLT